MSEDMVAAGSVRRWWPDSTLMSRLDESTGEELVSLVPGVRCRAGTVLISQGARDMRVYPPEPASSGSAACVKVTACLENGQEALLGIGVSGDVVGEQAVLRAAGAFGHGGGLLAAGGSPDPGPPVHGLPATAPQRLACPRADDHRAPGLGRPPPPEFRGARVRVHLARVIVELVDRHGYLVAGGYAPGVSLSQAELGRLIGAGQDATAIAVRQLRQAGRVKTRYRGLLVSDLPALRCRRRAGIASGNSFSGCCTNTRNASGSLPQNYATASFPLR